MIFSVLVFLQGFFSGGDNYHEPPTKLEIELQSVGVKDGTVVTLHCQVVNRGAGWTAVDAKAVMGNELLRVRFHDEKGHTVHFKGDNMLGYVPLDPGHPVALSEGCFLGFEQKYVLDHHPAHLKATAVFTYENFSKKPVSHLWEGTITSAPLKLW